MIHSILVFILGLAAFANALSPPWKCHKVPSHGDYSYCVSTPKGYNSKAAKKWPTLIYLSASGTRATLGNAPYTSAYSGVGYQLNQTLNGHLTKGGKFVHENFISVFVVAPLATVHFNQNAVKAAFNKVKKDFRVDTNRYYLTGYSMGCRGVLRELVFNGTGYAAAVCESGYAEKKDDQYITQQKALATFDRMERVKVPIAFYASAVDETNPASKTLATFKEIQKQGNKCAKYVDVKGKFSHSDMGFKVYDQVSVYKWLLQHSLASSKPCHIVTPKSKRHFGLH